MPKFFKKLFRRKKLSDQSYGDSSSGNPKLTRKQKKAQKKALKKARKDGSFMQGSYPQSILHNGTHSNPPGMIDEDTVIRKPSFPPVGSGGSNSYSTHSPVDSASKYGSQSLSGSYDDSFGSRSREGRGGRQQGLIEDDDYDPIGGNGRPVDPPSQFNHGANMAPMENPIFEADFSGFNNGPNAFRPDENNTNFDTRPNAQNYPQQNQGRPMSSNGNGALHFDQVREFERQMAQEPVKPLYPYDHPPSKKLQLTRLPNGQVVAMDRMAAGGSPMSASSEFDLSTDAEDNDYNQIRNGQRHSMPMLAPSPSSHSEEDISLNPMQSPQGSNASSGLEKNGHYISESETEDRSGFGPESSALNRSKHYFSDSDNDIDGSKASPTSTKMSASPSQLEPIPSDSRDSEDSPIHNTEVGGRGPTSRFTFENENDGSFDKTDFPEQGGVLPEDQRKETAVDGKEFEENSKLSPRTIAIQHAQQMRAQGKLPVDLYPDSTDSEFDPVERKKYVKPSNMLPARSPQDSVSDSSRGQLPPRQDGKRKEGIIENFADFSTDFGENPFKNRPSSKSVADVTSPVSQLLQEARNRRNARNNANSINSAPIDNPAFLRKHHNLKSNNDPASISAKEKLRRRRKEKEAFLESYSDDDSGRGKENINGKDASESWLFDEVTGALGPQGIAADLESLGGRSNRSRTSHKSHRSHRSHKSTTSHRSRRKRSDGSVASRQSKSSRASRYSHKSTRSHLSTMSDASRSVANDLLRLEMQLAMVGKNVGEKSNRTSGGASIGDASAGIKSMTSRKSSSTMAMPKRAKRNVTAPAGKLGIILANKTDAKGTVVSGVRTTSVLASKITPGDRIIAIDGEDVSTMTVSEITAIMARKNDFERVLSILTTSKR